ncbi:MAG: UDP-N-acetylmuramate--L-alanine ligase [Oligoflexales bacterium]
MAESKREKVYFMGIAGTGMASVAGMLQQTGVEVVGSDREIYPPMSTMLADLKIPVLTPYKADNLTKTSPDLVVVANSLSRGNPEVEHILKHKIPHTSFAALLGDRFLEKKKSIVVSGTHGKTTTCSLLSFFLQELDQDPSFLIGGIPRNFTKSYQLGKGSLFVVEGDEYDTAFFDKESKFLHYRPQIVILNNLEFDHADIFSNLEAIEDTFAKLLKLVPNPAQIIANIDDPGVSKLLNQLSIFNKVTKISAKGLTSTGDVKLNGSLAFDEEKGLWKIPLDTDLWGQMTLSCKLGGAHNAANIAMVIGCLSYMQQNGFLNKNCNAQELGEILLKFKSVRRRLDHLCTSKGIQVYEDFAHHPTAVKTVIESFRISHPDKRVIVAFEPRNATSRRKIFAADYTEALKKADVSLIGACANDERIPKQERMDTKEIAANVGDESHAFNTNGEVYDWLAQHSRAGDSVIFMSCGSFSGIVKKFCSSLKTASTPKYT